MQLNVEGLSAAKHLCIREEECRATSLMGATLLPINWTVTLWQMSSNLHSLNVDVNLQMIRMLKSVQIKRLFSKTLSFHKQPHNSNRKHDVTWPGACGSALKTDPWKLAPVHWPKVVQQQTSPEKWLKNMNRSTIGMLQVSGSPAQLQYGLTSHSTHYTSFRRLFYRSNDPTNSVTALTDDG